MESKTELEGCLIPKAGQHRCGGIPWFVRKLKKNPAQWQSVLGSHLSLNFWLKEEQPVAFYLSGVSSVIGNKVAAPHPFNLTPPASVFRLWMLRSRRYYLLTTFASSYRAPTAPGMLRSGPTSRNGLEL